MPPAPGSRAVTLVFVKTATSCLEPLEPKTFVVRVSRQRDELPSDPADPITISYDGSATHRMTEADAKCAERQVGCGCGCQGTLRLRNTVTTILVMSDTLPLSEVKAKLSEMVDRVEQQHDRITVTRNGRPAAVLMSPDDLASLEDTLDLLSDRSAMAEIARARREAKAGKTLSAEQLRAKYLTK